MTKNDAELCLELMNLIAAAGGIVVVDGRRMVKTNVARSVIRIFVCELFSEVFDSLPYLVSSDPKNTKKLIAELDVSERRVKEFILDKLPLLQ
jgi:hypothetical protein